jgi:D-alanyl-D-alanine carboxypeptidase
MVTSIQQGDVPTNVATVLAEATRQLARRRGVRHAVIGIEAGDGCFRWIGAAGVADQSGRPMRPETPYFLASVTKLYIGATILRLHEQRRLSLDDRITRFFPADFVTGLHRRRGTDRTGELTVRHLLGHASGLPEYISSPEDRRGRLVLVARSEPPRSSPWTQKDLGHPRRAARTP